MVLRLFLHFFRSKSKFFSSGNSDEKFFLSEGVRFLQIFRLWTEGRKNSHDTASNGHLDKYTKTKEVQAYEQYT